MSTVTLVDGREVDSASPEWQAECLARHEHVTTLLAMRGDGAKARRQSYLANQAVTEGEEAARRVRDRVESEWRTEVGHG